jgi:cell division protein FtsN
VVILTNGKRARWHGAKMQNEIIKWLVSYGKPGVPGGRDPMREKLELKDKVIWGELPDVKSAPSSASGQDSAPGKAFYIQVGSFGGVPEAAFLDKLRNRGFAYKVIEADQLYKVLVGPYADRSQAEKAVAKLKELASGAYITQL